MIPIFVFRFFTTFLSIWMGLSLSVCGRRGGKDEGNWKKKEKKKKPKPNKHFASILVVCLCERIEDEEEEEVTQSTSSMTIFLSLSSHVLCTINIYTKKWIKRHRHFFSLVSFGFWDETAQFSQDFFRFSATVSRYSASFVTGSQWRGARVPGRWSLPGAQRHFTITLRRGCREKTSF